MNKIGQGRAGRAAALVLLTVLGGWLGNGGMALRLAGIVVALVVTVVFTHWRRLLAVVKTLPRDLRFFWLLFRAKRVVRRLEQAQGNVPTAVERNARQTPDKVCFFFEDQKWTYKDVNDYSNRVARALQREGVCNGDVVALVMDNCIEYVCVWLGAAKVGAVTALINRNLRDQPLAHTINAPRSKVVVFADQFAGAVDAIRGDLPSVEKYLHFERDLVPLLEMQSADNPEVDTPPSFDDPIMYIYTSGTTGLPKAAIVSHGRLMCWSVGILYVADLSPARDVHYCSLPLYHAAAGAYGCSLALVHGVPVAYSAKFSASRFWEDCSKHGATTAQYIGELCRFLVLSPPSPRDRAHRVRTLIGNGMSPAVWRRVQERFGVPQITELYGSTEGNVMIVNADGKVGAIGCLPRLLPRSLLPVDIIKVDEENSEPVRDDITGLCVRCNEGEPGMIIGKIGDGAISQKFVGYVDRAATEKKIARDVFNEGDRYFLSGDLVVMDELGYIYFKDRTGDTFRWKGENVSTAEVDAALTRILLPQGVREVASYGVQVDGHEGRAGMAAIADPEHRVDLVELAERLGERLPSYAHPVFVRVCRALPMTSTHKVSKVVLQRQGLHDVPDDEAVFVLDSRTRRYEALDDARMQDIRDNTLRI